MRPVYPGKRPAYRPDVPCYTQELPDVNSARVGPPDGGQGPAAGGGEGGTGGGPTPALPQIPALPQLPSLPGVPTGVQDAVSGALPRARTEGTRSASLAGELVSRLNPFRKASRRAAARRRTATR